MLSLFISARCRVQITIFIILKYFRKLLKGKQTLTALWGRGGQENSGGPTAVQRSTQMSWVLLLQCPLRAAQMPLLPLLRPLRHWKYGLNSVQRCWSTFGQQQNIVQGSIMFWELASAAREAAVCGPGSGVAMVPGMPLREEIKVSKIKDHYHSCHLRKRRKCRRKEASMVYFPFFCGFLIIWFYVSHSGSIFGRKAGYKYFK